MKLSVIIPTYNRKHILVEALKAYFQQSYKDFEIIIVDDGSSDGTREAIQELKLPLKIRYILQDHKGPASARNLGIEKSEGEILLFTGDDIIPSKNLIEEHIRIYRSGSEKLAVLGYTQWAPEIKMTPFRKYITNRHFSYPNIIDEQNVYWAYFYTSNISIRKSFLGEVGFFDENFPYAAYEDSEIGYRLSQKGMRMIFNKKAVAYHNHPITFKSYQKTTLYRGAAAVILAKKVPQLKEKAIYQETKNPLRRFFKKIMFNGFILTVLTETICFLDKLFIPLPKIVYSKILDYYLVKGIKKYG